MSEKPILFSGPMVRAILDGPKTMTRRIIRPQPKPMSPFKPAALQGDWQWHRGGVSYTITNMPNGPSDIADDAPYQPGDVLWIKEAWQYAGWTEEGEPWIKYRADDSMHLCDVPEEWADRVEDVWAELSHKDNVAIDGKAADRKWRSSRFMPKWAARPDRLLVQSVRAEQLQDITEADAIAEGVVNKSGATYHDPYRNVPITPHVHDYMRLWDSINGPGAWARNDWVWVYGFERIKP